MPCDIIRSNESDCDRHQVAVGNLGGAGLPLGALRSIYNAQAGGQIKTRNTVNKHLWHQSMLAGRVVTISLFSERSTLNTPATAYFDARPRRSHDFQGTALTCTHPLQTHIFNQKPSQQDGSLALDSRYGCTEPFVEDDVDDDYSCGVTYALSDDGVATVTRVSIGE